MGDAESPPSVVAILIERLAADKDQKTLALWAADCAERVLPFFEEARPNDDRPRAAIGAGRAWARGKISVSESRDAAFAAHAAARETDQPAAQAAARAAGHAAATAHVAGHAVHAATYAAKAIARANPDNADLLIVGERDWQYQRLLDPGDHRRQPPPRDGAIRK